MEKLVDLEATPIVADRLRKVFQPFAGSKARVRTGSHAIQQEVVR